MNTIIEDTDVEQDYKELFFPVKSRLSLKEDMLIKNLFNKFPERELAYDLSDDQFTLFLNLLDVQVFTDSITQIKNDSNSSTMSELLDSILEKINSIKSYGLKNNKRMYIGYNDERKVKNRKSKEINRNKYYYAQDNNFSTINNQLPNYFENKIICGDSLDILKKLPDNCVDLVFTSPPYNFGLDYESNEDAHHWDNYFSKLFEIFNECIRILKYGGRIAVNTQPLFSDYIPSHHVISNFFMSKKMIWKGICIHAN